MGTASLVCLDRASMSSQATLARRRVPTGVSLGLALFLVALNLRTTVASLPPLLASIRHDLGITAAIAGLVTATPVLCMAWIAPSASLISRRLGSDVTVLASVSLIALGNGLRGLAPHGWFLIGATFVAGVGVALAGVVIPGVVKEVFPRHMGAAMGGFSVAMMLGAATGASFAAPLAATLGGWRPSLSLWAAPAAVAALIWVVVSRRRNARPDETVTRVVSHRLPWNSPPAWLLVAFMTAQSSLAYAYLGWLAPAFVQWGRSPASAGLLVGLNNVAQLTAALVLPALADRTGSFRAIVLLAVTLTVSGSLWLWLAPLVASPMAVVLLGLGLGAGFSLGLTRIGHFAADPDSARRLTALVFLVSYTVAALVPIAMGVIRDVSGDFSMAFATLVLIATAQLGVASRLGPQYIGAVR
jgi:MFS transporter, CP family, cyanate transporter